MYRSIILAGALALTAAPAVAQQTQVASTSSMSDQTYLDFQVEQTVRVKASVAPMYPERLRASRIEGQVIAQYVVDEKGNALMNTFKVLKSSDHAFTESVKAAVSNMTFFPAEKGGLKVRQLVQQPFKFAPSR